MFIFVWWSAEWLFQVDDYCWPVRRAETDFFSWVQSFSRCVCVCVCVCLLCVCCGSCSLCWNAAPLCACAYYVFMCVWCERSTVFSLHGPYPVKEVFAVTGITCRHLDSVAKEDLWHSERWSEGKITYQIWMWSWEGRERLSWVNYWKKKKKRKRKEEWEAERRWGG